MKRKNYNSPTTEVIRLRQPMLMQVTSPTEAAASRSNYGNANTYTWE